MSSKMVNKWSMTIDPAYFPVQPTFVQSTNVSQLTFDSNVSNRRIVKGRSISEEIWQLRENQYNIPKLIIKINSNLPKAFRST